MKRSITSFLFIGTGVGATAGLVGVGDRMQFWPVERILGAVSGFAIFGALVSILLYLLWSAKNSPVTADEIDAPDVGDYPIESHHHHHSNASTGSDVHHE